MDQVHQQVDTDHPGVEFSDTELSAALDQMQEDNQIMVSENVVFLISDLCYKHVGFLEQWLLYWAVSNVCFG